jgi:hypothetical protein
MGVVRRASIGTIVAIFGIATVPVGGALAAAKRHSVVCTATASRCGTLIVHVYGGGGPLGAPRGQERGGLLVLYNQPLLIAKLGTERGRVETSKHRLRLTPGDYLVMAEEVRPTKSAETDVVVRAGETREITLKINMK